MDPPRRVLGYVRVSGAEQARSGTSLDEQAATLRRWCAAQGYPEPTIYVEQESGSAERLERRAELHRLLAAAQGGDLVAVCTVDRWSRDLPWAVQSVRDLRRRGVRWYAVREQLDPTTDIGETLLGMMALGADLERRRGRERMVGTRKVIRDRGLWVEGPPPLGYRRPDGYATDKRRFRGQLVIYEPGAEVARWIYASLPATSLKRLLIQGRERWPSRAWNEANLLRMVRSRVHLGEVLNSEGVWIRGAHPALIDEATWRRAQEGLDARRGTGGRPARDDARPAQLLLRGIARCPCGRRICAVFGRARADGQRTAYYACNGRRKKAGCGEDYQEAGAVDAALSALALARLTEIRDALAAPVPAVAQAPAAATLARRRGALEARRARLIDLASRGEIELEDLRSARARLDAERSALAAEETAAAQPRLLSEAERAAALADVRQLRSAWCWMRVGARRLALEILASEIVISATGAARVAWREVSDLAKDVRTIVAQPLSVSASSELYSYRRAEGRRGQSRRRRRGGA